MKYSMAIVLCLLSIVPVLAVEPGVSFYYRDRVPADWGLSGKTDVTAEVSIYPSDEGTGDAIYKQVVSNVSIAANGVFCAEVGGTNEFGRLLAGVLSTAEDRYILARFQPSSGGDFVALHNGHRRKLMPLPRAMYARDARFAPGDFTVRGNAYFNDLQVMGTWTNLQTGAEQITKYGTEAQATSLRFDSLTGKGSLQGDNGKFVGDVAVNGKLTMMKAPNLQNVKTVSAQDANFVVKSIELKEDLAISAVPKGMIFMWYGNAKDVPPGWAICDGNNGTPDLTGRFVVGAKSGDFNPNDKGGSRGVSLTENQIPKHNHEIFGDDELDTGATKTRDYGSYDASSDKSGKSAWFQTSYTGSNKEHENRPPFKALYYIMKVK